VRRFLVLVANYFSHETTKCVSSQALKPPLAIKTVNPLARNNGNNGRLWSIIIDDILAMSLS
jgi:hypothetical protein